MLVPFVLGMLLGGVILGVCVVLHDWWVRRSTEQAILFQNDVLLAKSRADEKKWPPPEYQAECAWCYLGYGEEGWFTNSAGTFENLGKYLERTAEVPDEIVIPVFPSVFKPDMGDKLYYDAIGNSAIAPGDKVLVIGSGSGADTWAVSLKTQGLVYAIDINPMAIVNTYATARLGGYPVKAITGDVTKIDLPEDFSDFDFVLWNMPFIQSGASEESSVQQDFHDGDDGNLLKDFLELLPTLLKEDGTAIFLNSPAAREYVTFPGVTTKVDRCMLFIVPNPGGG